MTVVVCDLRFIIIIYYETRTVVHINTHVNVYIRYLIR